jgi:hypothetical protein
MPHQCKDLRKTESSKNLLTKIKFQFFRFYNFDIHVGLIKIATVVLFKKNIFMYTNTSRLLEVVFGLKVIKEYGTNIEDAPSPQESKAMASNFRKSPCILHNDITVWVL